MNKNFFCSVQADAGKRPCFVRPTCEWSSFRDAPALLFPVPCKKTQLFAVRPPPPPPGHTWDSTTVPAVVSVPLMCLQPVWFSHKVRHDVCGGRHRWARRNVIEDYKRGTASKYSICHTFVWEQKGWRTVSSYYEPIVFSYPCPPAPPVTL